MDESDEPTGATPNERPPAGWVVWNDEAGGRLVLVYRPDVFDATAFDAACLPTLYVSRRDPRERLSRRRPRPDGWHVALFLEPEVRVRDCDARYADRAVAVAAAHEVAAAFARGDVDYRAAYQVPRDRYLDELDALTGRDAG